MPLFTDAVASFRNRKVAQPVVTNDIQTYQAMLGGAIPLADGLTASYYQIYRSQPWVYAAVNMIARGMMRMPIKTFQRNGTEKQRVVGGDLYRLTEKRPAYGWTPSRHREAITKQIAIYGNSVVVKIGMDDESDTPDERMVAPAVGWSVGGDDTYVWTNPKNGERYPFERWRIEHYRFWDTDENGFGISPLEPLRVTLANDDAARRFGLAAFRNGARPASVLKTTQDIKPEVAQRLAAEWKSLHGGVDNAFKLAILSNGLDYATIQHDLDKSAVVPHRELTPVEVAAVYCIPASMIGWTKDANFASVDMFHTMLYQDSLGPWVVMFEETLQSDLVDVTPAFADLFVEIDQNAVMRGDLMTRVRAYATQITSAQKTPDEVRALENDPPMAETQPEAGRLLFPSNLAGAVGAQLAEDAGQEDKTNA